MVFRVYHRDLKRQSNAIYEILVLETERFPVVLSQLTIVRKVDFVWCTGKITRDNDRGIDIQARAHLYWLVGTTIFLGELGDIEGHRWVLVYSLAHYPGKGLRSVLGSSRSVTAIHHKRDAGDVECQ